MVYWLYLENIYPTYLFVTKFKGLMSLMEVKFNLAIWILTEINCCEKHTLQSPYILWGKY